MDEVAQQVVERTIARADEMWQRLQSDRKREFENLIETLKELRDKNEEVTERNRGGKLDPMYRDVENMADFGEGIVAGLDLAIMLVSCHL